MLYPCALVQLRTTDRELRTTDCELYHLQLITTLDGSEYVTPEKLEQELKDEIVVAGGRLNLIAP